MLVSLHKETQLLLSLDEQGALLSRITNPDNFILMLRKEHTYKSPPITRKIFKMQLLFIYYFKQDYYTSVATNFKLTDEH